ncbi:MAG: hypothetical protein Rubg2KO_33320 [Rubricoccaceae bacterium]
MRLEALTLKLQCPACGAELAYVPVEQNEAAAGECGLLQCPCSVYPLLDGVPILRRGRLAHHTISDARIVAEGDDVAEIVTAIKGGEGLHALVRVLSVPICPWPLNRIGALRRLSIREPMRSVGLSLRQRRIRRMLMRRDSLTAEDWMAAFTWHAPVAEDPFNYFFFRFGQPRHLAALAITSILPVSEAPVLDLACGYGHILHTLTALGHPAVGLDQNAHQAWVGHHYVAPGAAFVCADADAPLPFRDGAFGAAVCSDAFHYIADKARTVQELQRCARGPVLLATVSNALVPPIDGAELTPARYAALFGEARWRVTTEAELLARYLNGQKPDLTTSVSEDALRGEKWLSYVITEDEALFRDHESFDRWPHLEGMEVLNLLYERDRDGVRLRFPSPWYAVENRALLNMLPARIAQDDLDAGRYSPLARVGRPSRYARNRGRPLAFRAHRALGALLSSQR